MSSAAGGGVESLRLLCARRITSNVPPIRWQDLPMPKVVKDLLTLVRGVVASAGVGRAGRDVRVWSVDDHQHPLRVLRGHSDTVKCLAILPSGNIVSGSDDHTLRLWNIHTGACVRHYSGHQDWVECVATLDPAGTSFVSGSQDRSLRVWNVATGECTAVLPGHTWWVTCVAALSGTQFVSGSEDTTLRVWDMGADGAGEPPGAVRILRGHHRAVTAVCVIDEVSPQRIVSASVDTTICVWNAASGNLVQRLTAHRACVNTVIRLAGQRIVSGDSNGDIFVWSLGNAQPIAVLDDHAGTEVMHLAALPNHNVVSAARDGGVLVWDIQRGYPVNGLENNRLSALMTVPPQPAQPAAHGAADAPPLLTPVVAANPGPEGDEEEEGEEGEEEATV